MVCVLVVWNFTNTSKTSFLRRHRWLLGIEWTNSPAVSPKTFHPIAFQTMTVIIKTVRVRFGLVRNTGIPAFRDSALKFAVCEAGPTPHYATGARDLTFDTAEKDIDLQTMYRAYEKNLFWGWNACFGVASGVAKTQQKPWRPARPVDRNLFGTSVPCSWIRYERRMFFLRQRMKKLIHWSEISCV